MLRLPVIELNISVNLTLPIQFNSLYWGSLAIAIFLRYFREISHIKSADQIKINFIIWEILSGKLMSFSGFLCLYFMNCLPNGIK